MGGSGLDLTDDFQKFCASVLDWIQLLQIRIGLGLNNFTVRSSLPDKLENGAQHAMKSRLVSEENGAQVIYI